MKCSSIKQLIDLAPVSSTVLVESAGNLNDLDMAAANSKGFAEGGPGSKKAAPPVKEDGA